MSKKKDVDQLLQLVSNGGKMKKIVLIVCMLYATFHLFSQEIIYLSKGQEILQIGIINDSTPVYIIEESNQVLNSTTVSYYVIAGKEMSGPYDYCSDLLFSPCGKTLAFEAEIDEKSYIIFEKEINGPYDFCFELSYSPDGKTLAYTVKIDSEFYVIAGKEKAGPYDNCFDLFYFHDGNTLAYRALIDNNIYSFVLIDGHQFLGSVINNKTIYIDNNQIIIK